MKLACLPLTLCTMSMRLTALSGTRASSRLFGRKINTLFVFTPSAFSSLLLLLLPGFTHRIYTSQTLILLQAVLSGQTTLGLL